MQEDADPGGCVSYDRPPRVLARIRLRFQDVHTRVRRNASQIIRHSDSGAVSHGPAGLLHWGRVRLDDRVIFRRSSGGSLLRLGRGDQRPDVPPLILSPEKAEELAVYGPEPDGEIGGCGCDDVAPAYLQPDKCLSQDTHGPIETKLPKRKNAEKRSFI